MTQIVDAASLIALIDRRDPLQPTIEQVLRDGPGELVLPAPVSAGALRFSPAIHLSG